MLKPITLKCVKEFNNTSKWRGKLSTQQLLNSPLGKYLDINRTDAVAEVGINFHGDKVSTFGIKIHPKRGDRYETRIYGHIQKALLREPEKRHTMMRGSEKNRFSNNSINYHLQGDQYGDGDTSTKMLFEDMTTKWTRVHELSAILKYHVVDSFNQKACEILKPVLNKKEIFKANKASNLERIKQLDVTINAFEAADSAVKNIDKTIKDDLKAGKTIYNMSFRQLEKSNAQKIVDELKKDYEIAIAEKNAILEKLNNKEIFNTEKTDKRYEKNITKKANFCNTHGISGKTLQDYYETHTEVSGEKNLKDLLDKLGE